MERKDGNMNTVLRRVALIMGIILLLISIKWSKDGFNFSVAGDASGTDVAALIGYSLAVAVTVVQFVFSTNMRELNASLVVFGLLAYAYSIYTNYEGIVQFQGSTPNHIMAGVLGFVMDGVPEPLIAWGLKESLSGDFVGNLFKGIGMFFTGKYPERSSQQPQHPQQPQQQGKHKHGNREEREKHLARLREGLRNHESPEGEKSEKIERVPMFQSVNRKDHR